MKFYEAYNSDPSAVFRGQLLSLILFVEELLLCTSTKRTFALIGMHLSR